MRGHVVPAFEVQTLREEDANLGVVAPGGSWRGRCLRCDLWLARPGPVAGAAAETLDDLAELPRPRRGADVDEAIVLRLISIERGVHAVAFTLLAVGLIYLKLRFGSIRHWSQSLLGELSAGGHPTLSRELGKLAGLHSAELTVLAITAVAYALIEGIEAVGLWKEKRWAEYLTVLATAGFLPLEIHELMARVTVLRLGALVVNLGILVYLVVAKRLFGVRGGPKAARNANRIDWDAVLAQPSATRHVLAVPAGVAGFTAADAPDDASAEKGSAS